MIKSNRRSRGFTLIELLVVVLILGILLAIAIPAYLNSVTNSKERTASSNAKAIATAIQAKYVAGGGLTYDTGWLTDAAVLKDLGGALPSNPCGGSYTLTTNGATAGITVKPDVTAPCIAGVGHIENAVLGGG